MKNNPAYAFFEELLLLQKNSGQSLPDLPALRKELSDKYNDFIDYVWKNSFHDRDMEQPVATLPETIVQPEEDYFASYEGKLKQIAEGMNALGIGDKVYPAFFKKRSIKSDKSDTNVNPNIIFKTIITDKHSTMSIIDHNEGVPDMEVGKLYFEYAGKASEYIKEVLAAVSSSLATSVFAETEVRKDNNGRPKDYYRGVGYTDEQLSILYSRMVDGHWIDSQANREEFIYYFSGNGPQPVQKLRWLRSCVLLTAFLYNVVDDGKMWAKTGRIFEAFSEKENRFVPIDRNNIKSVFRAGQQADIWVDEHIPAIRDLLNDI